MASDVSIRVGVDGAAEFRTAIRSMNSQMRELDSEMRALTSGINSLDDAEAAAGQRMSILQRQAQLTEQRIQTLTQQYDRQVAKLQELGRAQEEAMRSGNEAEITRTTNAYNRQQQAVNDLSRQLNNARSDMNRFEQNMRDVENGTDRLTESFRDAGNAADDMGSGLANAFTAGAVSGAVQSLISGIGSLIDSTMEYQRIMAALETSSANAGYSAEQTEASYRQLYGVLGDEQSSATALSNLQALGLSQNELTTMIDGTIGAWAKYGDSIPIDSLAEAINETAKVGTVTGTFADVLNWAGTSEDEFNEKLAACNTEQERTQLIMDELSKQGLPGMADAYRENNSALVETYDAQAKMNDALSQTAEAIMPLAAAITGGLASALDALQPAIQFVVDNIEAVIAGISAFLAVLAVQKIVSFVSAVGGLGNALLTLAGGPIGLIATAVAAAVAAIVYLWNNCEGFREAVITIGEGIQTAVSAVVEFVKTLFTGLVEFFTVIIEGIKTAWSGVTDFFTTLWTTIVTAIQTVWSGIVAFFTTIAEGIKAVWNGVTEFFTMIFTNAVTAIQMVWGGIVAFFTTIWTGIQTVFSAVVEFFSGIFSGAVTAVQSVWSGVTAFFSGIWAGIQSIFSVVASVLGGFFQSAVSAIQSAWSGVTAFFSGIWSGIQGIFSSVSSVLGGFFRSAASAVQSAWNGVTSFFSGIWGKIKSVFSDAASTFLSIGRNIVNGIKNGISNAWSSLVSWVKSKFSGLIDSVLGIFGIHSPSRVFAEIGDQVMQGFAVGIEDNKSAGNAMTKQMTSVKQTALNTANRLNDAIIRQEQKLNQQLAQLNQAASDEQTQALKEQVQSQISTLNTYKQEYRSALQEIEQAQTSMADKLKDYGDLFETVQLETGGSLIEISDLQDDINAINAYGDALERLKSRGVSEGLLDEITNLDIDSTIAYTEQLLDMTDDQYEKYMDLWQQKQEAAEEVARKFYQDELDAMTEEFVDKIPGELSGLKDDMRNIGVNSIQGLINGLKSMSGMLSSTARQIISDAISAMRDEADIHSPSGATERLIGKPLAQGVEVGFLDQLASIKNSMSSAIMAPFSRITTADLYGATAGMVNGMAAAAPTGGMMSTVIIPVNLNGKKIAEVIYDPLKRVGKQRGY